jgi:ribosomal protein S18 acetylase RimI-like enzyme
LGRTSQSYRDFPHVTGDREVMWKLYVHPDHQGRGIGRRLLAEVEALVEGDALWLEVVDGNRQAYDFYRAHGFEEVERVGDGRWPDDVWMRKHLGRGS